METVNPSGTSRAQANTGVCPVCGDGTYKAWEERKVLVADCGPLDCYDPAVNGDLGNQRLE